MQRSRQIASPPHERPLLRVRFNTPEEFWREYQANVLRGGLFIPSETPLELRQEVEVELGLAFRGASLRFAGEVVSVVPAELAQTGGTPGVAVQILEPAAELLPQIEAIAGQAPELDPGRQVGERRVAPRTSVRVVGRLSTADASLAVRTRNLSHSGVLVSLEGISLTPVGEDVQFSLAHPITGQQLDVRGTVVRHVESEGGVPALAVAFSGREAARPEVQRFVDDLHSLGHARSLAGISGRIEEVGLANLIQSFASASPAGTLTLSRGVEEGRVVFKGGQLLSAQLGPVSDPKALARLVAWEEGSFEFHAHVEDAECWEKPIPLTHALLEAARQLDETGRLHPLPFALADKVVVAAPLLEREYGQLSKTDEAIIDLAAAGFSVRGILDVIPEDDHVILQSLCGLLDCGVIAKAL